MAGEPLAGQRRAEHPAAGRPRAPRRPAALPPPRDRHRGAQHLQEASDLQAEGAAARAPPRQAPHRGPHHRVVQVPGGPAPGPQPAGQDRDRLLALPALAGRRGDRVEEADGVQEGRGGGGGSHRGDEEPAGAAAAGAEQGHLQPREAHPEGGDGEIAADPQENPLAAGPDALPHVAAHGELQELLAARLGQEHPHPAAVGGVRLCRQREGQPGVAERPARAHGQRQLPAQHVGAEDLPLRDARGDEQRPREAAARRGQDQARASPLARGLRARLRDAPRGVRQAGAVEAQRAQEESLPLLSPAAGPVGSPRPPPRHHHHHPQRRGAPEPDTATPGAGGGHGRSRGHGRPRRAGAASRAAGARAPAPGLARPLPGCRRSARPSPGLWAAGRGGGEGAGRNGRLPPALLPCPRRPAPVPSPSPAAKPCWDVKNVIYGETTGPFSPFTATSPNDISINIYINMGCFLIGIQ